MRLTKLRAYKITWIDPQSLEGWQSMEELKQVSPAITTGVYHYIGVGAAGLLFAGEINGEEYGNTTILPKEVIKSIKIIKWQ